MHQWDQITILMRASLNGARAILPRSTTARGSAVFEGILHLKRRQLEIRSGPCLQAVRSDL